MYWMVGLNAFIILTLYVLGSKMKLILLAVASSYFFIELVITVVMYKILVNISKPTIFTGASDLKVFEEINSLIESASDKMQDAEEELFISTGRAIQSINNGIKSDRDFAVNVFDIWGTKESTLRLGIVGAFYLIDVEGGQGE
jgi:hypothetical protein